MAATEKSQREQKFRSLFDIPSNFFDSCSLLFDHPLITPNEEASSSHQHTSDAAVASADSVAVGKEPYLKVAEEKVKGATQRWTCNTCKSEFESPQDQRSHFKSDLHRLNIKLSVAGKNIVKEEEFDEQGCDYSFEDFDVSSISGSEDELEKGAVTSSFKTREGVKQKLYLHLHSGETVSVWRSLILDESEDVSLYDYKVNRMRNDGSALSIGEDELTNRLKYLLSEPRDKSHLRIVLLLTGGHFAGCVFDGNSIIAHKTFHRYVVRAKAGKRQSTKDATGKSAHSAGSSLRRHNEAALKKAEKDAKRKAKAKELKKLRKAKEKVKEQESAVCVDPSKQQVLSNVRKQISEEGTMRVAPSRQHPKSNVVAISKEEEEKLALAAEREKRAAAAERRIAAIKEGNTAVSSSDTKGLADDLLCFCCNVSLAGKIPFHRYHYKYCSTLCMHIHMEILEDG